MTVKLPVQKPGSFIIIPQISFTNIHFYDKLYLFFLIHTGSFSVNKIRYQLKI